MCSILRELGFSRASHCPCECIPYTNKQMNTLDTLAYQMRKMVVARERLQNKTDAQVNILNKKALTGHTFQESAGAQEVTSSSMATKVQPTYTRKS